MTEREMFLYELSGRGFEFKNKTWLSGLGGNDGFFEDDQLNMVWEMWQASAQREGFKFVPVEPTRKMIDIGDEIQAYADEWVDVSNLYKAMIGAVDE